MTNIINLNKKRKAKKKAEKEKKAAENRIKFGRTKQEKKMVKKTVEQERRNLDGHKLEKVEQDKRITPSVIIRAPEEDTRKNDD